LVAEGACADCGHIWRLHPGVAVSITACAECIYEEDIGERAVEDLCRKTPADISEQTAERLLALLSEEVESLVRDGRASVSPRPVSTSATTETRPLTSYSRLVRVRWPCA